MNTNEIVTKKDLIDFEVRLFDQFKKISKIGNPPKYLRTKDISKMFGISISTIQNLRIKGILPYKKVGGTIFYKLEEVEASLFNSKK